MCTTAALLICVLPVAAAGAGPGQQNGCSAGVCVEVDGGTAPGTPSAGHVFVKYDLSFPGKTIAAGSVLTMHQDPGLTVDPGSLAVPASASPSVTTSGNDLVVTFGHSAFALLHVQYTASIDAGQTGVLTAWARFDFSAAGGGPPTTSTSRDLSVYAGPDLQINQLSTQFNPDLGSTDIGFATTRLPHGYTSTAQAQLANQSSRDLAAGAPFDIQLSAGFSLADSGVHAGVRFGSGDGPGTALTCTGSAATWTCTLPALAAGEITSLVVGVHVAGAAHVGQAGTIRLSIPPAAIGDVDPSDNEVDRQVTVEAVAAPAATVQVDPTPVPVGGSATVTVRVTNNGPDSLPPALLVAIDSDDPTSGIATVTDTGGGHLTADGAVRFDDLATLEPGASETVTIRFTANHAQPGVRIAAYVGGGAGAFVFVRCADGSTTGCPATETVDFVAAAADVRQRTAPLAATGPDLPGIALLGAALVLLGAFVLFGSQKSRLRAVRSQDPDRRQFDH
jgi:hypothetical protein